MAKVLRCRDAGMDGDFVDRGRTEEKLLKKAAEHAQSAHNRRESPIEVVKRCGRPFGTRSSAALIGIWPAA